MKKLAFLALASLLLISAGLMAEETTFGEALTLETAQSVDELLKNAADQVGERVQVEGRIADVCQNMGCWVSIASEESTETIRFKVEDGVIVFPPTVKGSHARAEGTLVEVKMDLEKSKSYMVHMAEERGEELDPETVTEAISFFQIEGVGAVLD